jgi:hypothetical protein
VDRYRVARVAIFAALFIATFFLVRWWDFTVPTVARAHYQAVFLTNGQAYFGRYVDRLGPYIKVEDPYYIQQTKAATEGVPAEQKLVRRGQELHNPEGAILVPKSAILFVEDLQDTSQFAQFMDKDRGK